VKAIIYSHSHYVNGAAAIAEGGRDGDRPSQRQCNRQLAAAGSYYGELAPLQVARAFGQFHTLLPKDGPDAPVVGALYPAAAPYVPVNRPVQDGETLTVAGVRMQFFTRYGSDTDDCVHRVAARSEGRADQPLLADDAQRVHPAGCEVP
jgi:hypothetical protein